MSENTFACLAGDGVGPELMAAATRALDRVAHLHSLELADVHLPFAGEAVTRSGHPLPAETRSAYRDVDAILVSSQHEPAFEGVKADSPESELRRIAPDHPVFLIQSSP